MKVWVVSYAEDDYGGFDGIFASKELAEQYAATYPSYMQAEVDEVEVLTELPHTVIGYYAQRDHRSGRIVAGQNQWSSHALPDNETCGPHIAWSLESVKDARRLLAEKEGRR